MSQNSSTANVTARTSSLDVLKTAGSSSMTHTWLVIIINQSEYAIHDVTKNAVQKFYHIPQVRFYNLC